AADCAGVEMKVAIVGAGYAGLSLCWHLLETRGVEVTVFDEGSGEGASVASTGLLHPFPGKFGKLACRAHDAMREANRLIEAAGEGSSSATGILRLAMSDSQALAFWQNASDGAQYLDKEGVQKLLPSAIAQAGLWIPEGKTVFSKPYLQGL